MPLRAFAEQRGALRDADAQRSRARPTDCSRSRRPTRTSAGALRAARRRRAQRPSGAAARCASARLGRGGVKRCRTCRTRYLGLELRTPLVASSSPLTGTLDGAAAPRGRRRRGGRAAVALRGGAHRRVRSRCTTRSKRAPECFAEALGLPARAPGLRRRAPTATSSSSPLRKRALAIPVIASLNGATPGGWLEYARGIEQAGADALELNLYQVAADPAHSSAADRGARPRAGRDGARADRGSRSR